MLSSSVDTPLGVLRWDGPLTPETFLTMPDGSTVPLYALISHTNGRALTWLAEYL